MASKIKKKIQEEILEVASELDEGSTKALVLESLYNQIEKQDDDTGIVNTVWANKELPLKMFTSDEINMMPSVKELLIGEPRTGKVDLEKSFGKDWKEHFNDIPITQIDLVAEKNGVSRDKLLSKMQDEVVKQQRYDIAHEGVLGKSMSLLAPRIQEAVERGESPSASDIAGDAIETGLYAVPYGRIAGAGAKLARKALIQGIASNVAPPLLNEASDAVLYDESNPRGNFSATDVAVGTGTNIVVPTVIRRLGTFLERGNLPGRALSQFGDGITPSEYASQKVSNMVLPLEGATQEARTLQKSYNNASKAIQNVILDKDKNIVDIVSQEGNSLGEKAAKYIRSKGKDPKTHYVTETGKIYEKPDPEFPNASDGLYEVYDNVLAGIESSTKSGKRLAAEEALKNFGSNKFGDTYAESNKPLGRIPIIGNSVQSYIDEANKEEERRKLEEEIERQYQIDLIFGRQR